MQESKRLFFILMMLAGWAAAPAFFAGISALYSWRTAYVAAAVMYLCILLLMVWQRDKLLTHAVAHHPDTPVEHSMAFMKLPVVWWCFGFFLLSTMTPSISKAAPNGALMRSRRPWRRGRRSQFVCPDGGGANRASRSCRLCAGRDAPARPGL